MKSYRELRPLDPSWRKLYLPRLKAGEIIDKKRLSPKQAKDLDYACSHIIISHGHKAILDTYKDESVPALYRVDWPTEEKPSTVRELLWEASLTYYENFNTIEYRALRRLASDVVNNNTPKDLVAAFKTRYGRKFLHFLTRYVIDGGPSSRDLISVYPALVLAALRVSYPNFDPDTAYSSKELSHLLSITKSNEFTTLVLSFVALDDLVFSYLLKHGRRTDPPEELAFMPDGTPTEIFNRFEFADGVIQKNGDGFRINPAVASHIRELIEQDQAVAYPNRPAHRSVRRECPFMYVDFNREFIHFLVNNMSKFVVEHKARLESDPAETTV